MLSTTQIALDEFINKIQFYIGQQGYLVLVKNKPHDSPEFALLTELEYVLEYFFDNTFLDKTDTEILALIALFETRYNLNTLPYIVYPFRKTEILRGDGVSGLADSSFIEEAPSDSGLYGRKNRTWVEIASALSTITNLDITHYNEAYSWGNHSLMGYVINETDPTVGAHIKAITPLNLTNYNSAFSWGNHALVGYITTESDPTVGAHIKSITTQEKTNWNNAFAWGNHNLSGYALASNLHSAVALSGSPNGLTLTGQVIGLNVATQAVAGAMSASDKTKLDNFTVHDPVTLGASTNGLSLSGQAISLSLATNLVGGAMSSADKVKLNSLENYVHPSNFTSQPTAPLAASNVISQITVNGEGHVTGVITRALSLSNLGVTKGTLTRVDDTNVTLTLGGTPIDSLFENVSLTLGWAGTLSVPRGGTGVGSFTEGQILVGNGILPISTISRVGIDTRTVFPSAAHTLTSHTDVSLTNPQAGQVLVFQGGIWINSTLSSAGITLTETDPIFTAWRDTIRTANQFYAAPNGTNGIAGFRSILREDLPNIYVRFDTNVQGLTATQKSNALTNLGAQASITPTDVIGDPIIGVTNGVGKVIGPLNLTLAHATSGWVDKTTLSGANIISNLTVNSTGHISNWTTRVLTLADLGFVAFNPASLEAAIANHESRITTLETNFPLLNGDKNFVHVQAAAATTWTFTHNLGKKPSVTIIDSAGSIILAKITYTNLNSITIDFNATLTSGEAICN